MRLASILLTLAISPIALVTVACGGDGVAVGDYRAYRLASTEAKLTGDCFTDDPTQEESTNFRSGGTILIYNAPEGDEDEYFLDLGGTVFPGEQGDDGTYEFKGEREEIAIGGTTIRDSDHDGTEDNEEVAPNIVDADEDAISDVAVPPDFMSDPFVDVDADGFDDRTDDPDGVDQDNNGIDDRDVFTPNGTEIKTKETYTIEVLAEGGKVSGTFVLNTDTSCSGGECGAFQPFKCKSTTEFLGVEIDPESVSVPIGSGGP